MTKEFKEDQMSEKDVINEYCKNLVEALHFTEMQNADFAKVMSVTIWNIVEFGMFHTKGSIPVVTSIIVETMAASGLRRVNLSEYAPVNKISIKSDLSLENNANPATVLLLIHAMEILEEFIASSRPSNQFH